jgi:Protein of unknown function (DUF2905)
MFAVSFKPLEDAEHLLGPSAIANENPKGTVPPGQSFLPGDIKYESPNGNVRIYFPIVTSLVLSVLFTLILRFIGRPRSFP